MRLQVNKNWRSKWFANKRDYATFLLQDLEVRRMIQAGGKDTLDDLQARILADKALDFVYRHAMIQG